MAVFDPVDTSLNFPELESRILDFWKKCDIFHKSMKLREGAPHWVFYEGPPTANGRPHPGHALTRVVKDLFPRYKTMRGYCVPRKAGWDTHGLPVEIEVEKELNISGKDQILEYGVEPFVRKCMESVFRYTTEWEEFTEGLGFWIDLSEAYITYHKSYVESVWWSLKTLHQKGLLYEGHKIVPYCPRCGTALSSHEVGQGYKEVEDPSVFVTFRCVDDEKTSFLAWTTTPWTLPSNSGLAILADTEYSHVRVEDEVLIMASALVEKVMDKIPHEVVRTEPGSQLVGRRYRPLFPWWQGDDESRASAWRVVAADFVTLDTGSGIVHIAPAFGADDYAAGQKEGLPVIQLVDEQGCFTPECGEFAGRFVKDADSDLIKDLRARGLLLKREVYRHDYPHCWRCKSPLIYYARGGWFIKTTSEIDRIMANNQAIQWLPEHIRDGRFGNFLENNVDWALSRERFWGTPLPFWKCEECGRTESVASLDELHRQPDVRGEEVFVEARKKDPQLNENLCVHKPWIDEITFACGQCPDARMRRVPEVIDCWYDSGAMPFAQWGYPHVPGSKEIFEKAFPADFISEAIDQTRGWFYSLLAESTMLFDKQFAHPYKNCVVLGHVCDEKGEKMSKHKGNYIDPMEILREEGADALRWFFYAANHPWTSARFSRSSVRESQREFLMKVWNVYSFFTIYANIDGFDPASALKPETGEQCSFRGGQPLSGRTLLDRWILSELHRTTRALCDRLDAYDIFAAAAELSEFAESLSNWYVQRTRPRFWRSWKTDDRSDVEDLDKLDAYWTLYECLLTLARLMAPFVPFMAEALWQNLVVKALGGGMLESVHLCDYPEEDADTVDETLSAEMSLVREVVALGRNARSASRLKVRLPLQEMILVLADPADARLLESHAGTLREALNVKAVAFAEEAKKYVDYRVQPNFPEIGAKYRALVPGIKRALADSDAAVLLSQLEADGKCRLDVEGQQVSLSQEEVQVTISAKEGYAAAGGRHVVVVLDTHLTQELLDEGFARELVNRINRIRNELNLKYEQRVELGFCGGEKAMAIMEKFEEYVRNETLAVAVHRGDCPEDWSSHSVEVEGEPIRLAVKPL